MTEARFKAGLDASKLQVGQAAYHSADAKVMFAEATARRANPAARR